MHLQANSFQYCQTWHEAAFAVVVGHTCHAGGLFWALAIPVCSYLVMSSARAQVG